MKIKNPIYNNENVWSIIRSCVYPTRKRKPYSYSRCRKYRLYGPYRDSFRVILKNGKQF